MWVSNRTSRKRENVIQNESIHDVICVRHCLQQGWVQFTFQFNSSQLIQFNSTQFNSGELNWIGPPKKTTWIELNWRPKISKMNWIELRIGVFGQFNFALNWTELRFHRMVSALRNPLNSMYNWPETPLTGNIHRRPPYLCTKKAFRTFLKNYIGIFCFETA